MPAARLAEVHYEPHHHRNTIVTEVAVDPELTPRKSPRVVNSSSLAFAVESLEHLNSCLYVFMCLQQYSVEHGVVSGLSVDRKLSHWFGLYVRLSAV